MRLRTLLVVTVVAGLLLTPSAAFAGGWFSGIDLQGRYLGIGESLTFRSEVMFRNLEDAERARDSGEFHAYLVRGIDHRALNEATLVAEPKHWWSPPKELRLIGDVRLSKWNANLAVATAVIDVPEVTPGSYPHALQPWLWQATGEPVSPTSPSFTGRPYGSNRSETREDKPPV